MRTYRIIAILVSFIFLCYSFFFFFKGAVKNGKNITGNQKMLLLGRYLFFDRRLSINNTKSCGTCHNPQLAFTDGYKRSLGVFADLHQRNTTPLFNLAGLKYFTAADSTLHSVFQQMNNPLFNTHPVEMGLTGNEDEILSRIAGDSLYKKMFAETFYNQQPLFSLDHIKQAIGTFILSVISNNAPYDRYTKGDSTALNASQKKGMHLFFSATLKCSSCHGGTNFSAPTVTNSRGDTLYYFNTGLYNTDGAGAYPSYDQGLFQYTHNTADMGSFRVPTLRNLAFTAPYFHDGSAASLTDVVEAYAAGGRAITQGMYKGDGAANPYKHSLVQGFNIGSQDKIHLINFLLSLSDSACINNPAYQNPFAGDETKKK